MATTKVELSFFDLRTLAMCVHDCARNLHRQDLLFSHRSAANGLFSLADDLDGLVSALEPTDKVTIQKSV